MPSSPMLKITSETRTSTIVKPAVRPANADVTCGRMDVTDS